MVVPERREDNSNTGATAQPNAQSATATHSKHGGNNGNKPKQEARERNVEDCGTNHRSRHCLPVRPSNIEPTSDLEQKQKKAYNTQRHGKNSG
jgi:hypothetical protein